jgi:hypothetical protein
VTDEQIKEVLRGVGCEYLMDPLDSHYAAAGVRAVADAASLTIKRIELKPGDSVVIFTERTLSAEMHKALKHYISSTLDVDRVLILEVGMGIALLSKDEWRER